MDTKDVLSGLGNDFSILGQKIKGSIDYLETFNKPKNVSSIRMICREFTSVCPITGQPDFSMITIDYIPDEKCIESKSLKLYLQRYREEGVFCEDLSARIAQDIFRFVETKYVRVTIQQAPRGGIEILSTSEVGVREDA